MPDRRRARRPRGRKAGRAVLTVVKVGGGLAREAGDGALRALCAAIARAGRAPSAARRARRRRFRGSRPRARSPLRPAAAQRALDGDPRHGPVRLAAGRPDPGGGAPPGPRARPRRRRPGPPPRRAAGGARSPARLVGGHLRLDRRLGGRRGGRRAPRAGQARRGALPRVAAGRRADRAADPRRSLPRSGPAASITTCPRPSRPPARRRGSSTAAIRPGWPSCSTRDAPRGRASVRHRLEP